MGQHIVYLLFAPLVLIVVAGAALRLRHRRIQRDIATVPDGWAGARARVVDERTRMQNRPGYTEVGRGFVFIRTPIVRFATPDGLDVTATSQVEGTHMPRPGADVTVWYDPVDPRRARVAAESIPRTGRLISGFVWTFLLVVFLLLGGLFAFFAWAATR